ncbi:Conserved_hypothetical protein [Hexamita inflata]|uniref:Uncharacterized protein n=1 Tax=Hexamita inflata TaxID=28002 RepID=A0AA86NZ69_9EUKA|nr:Conserved hypothetical protein [Hexamita inflata]
MEKLDQLGYQIPSDQIMQQKATLILKQIAAQLEQTKDVLWCCLDGEQKLEPTDAFHAITSEIHGLLLQSSQIHKLYSSQLLEQKQLTEALTEQLSQMKKTTSQNAQSVVTSQIDQIKSTYQLEAQRIREQNEELRAQLEQQIQLNVALEKENIIMRSEQPVPTTSNDPLAKRLIFQKEMLEQQIQDLQSQRDQIDYQMQSYSQLIELAKQELHQKGIEHAVTTHLTQCLSKLAQLTQEYEQLKTDLVQAKQELNTYKNQNEKFKQEKNQLKQQWTIMLDTVCEKVGIEL